ncbi:transmembrane protein 223-like [Paramacrobiotus metropolitanus]|uniref:transmembrane protein 223-like n=1 Tax=Paramacrobiotus metropolitanus TaxID=2943436 RepID=UPI0024461CD4|nr:transmembrane protein 223-like [Paramacrobiotus metropolitanus]
MVLGARLVSLCLGELRRSILKFSSPGSVLLAGRQVLARRVHTAEAPSPYQSSERYTNVAKDVVLYTFKSVRWYRYMTMFAAAQFFLWAQLAHFSLQNYARIMENRRQAKAAAANGGTDDAADLPALTDASTGMKDAEGGSSRSTVSHVTGDLENSTNNSPPRVQGSLNRWYVKYIMGQMDEDRPYYSLTMGILYLFTGVVLAHLGFLYALRSVAMLVLRKGGQQVTVMTYAPFGFTRSFTVPIDNMTAKQGRQGVRAFLSLKIRGRPLYFLMDMSGTFHNPALFDVTAGLHRSWRK